MKTPRNTILDEDAQRKVEEVVKEALYGKGMMYPPGYVKELALDLAATIEEIVDLECERRSSAPKRSRRWYGEKIDEARKLAETVAIADRAGRVDRFHFAQLERLVGGRRNAIYHLEVARERLAQDDEHA